jgi:hypothetical protein
MVQIQVAFDGTGESAGGLNGLSERIGEAAPDLEGIPDAAETRLCREDRFIGFGMTVTLGDDFRNPAYIHISPIPSKNEPPLSYVEFIFIDILQIQRHGVLSRLVFVDIAYSVRCEVYLAILLVGKLVLPRRQTYISLLLSKIVL